MIASGRIKGAKLPSGEIGVSQNDLDQLITREQFEHLRGKSITINQASESYGIHPETIRGWVKQGYIAVLKEGYGKELDLADVEYCVAVYRSLGGARGKCLFDADRRP
jgi:hypothetical protein